MDFHQTMDYHQTSGFEHHLDSSMSPEYDSSALNTNSLAQLKTSGAKKFNEAYTQQSRIQGGDKKASAFKLNLLQKSLDESIVPTHSSESKIPGYGEAKAGFFAPIPHRPRKEHRSHAKKSTNVPKTVVTAPAPKVSKIPSDVPTNMTRIDGEGRYTFSSRIKGFQNLKVFKARNASFLNQPVAIGDCNGLFCVIHKSSGEVQESFEMYTKATWLEFLTELQNERHPTGTHHDVAPEDDDEPGYEWDYFIVDVLLLSGAE